MVNIRLIIGIALLAGAVFHGSVLYWFLGTMVLARWAYVADQPHTRRKPKWNQRIGGRTKEGNIIWINMGPEGKK